MTPQKIRQLTLHMMQEKTHRISDEMYSLEGVMAYPRSSRAFSILKVERIDAMLKYRDDRAMCLPGQILKTIRRRQYHAPFAVRLNERSITETIQVNLTHRRPKPKAIVGSRTSGFNSPSFKKRSGLNSNGSG
jgi:hypothetical protein